MKTNTITRSGPYKAPSGLPASLDDERRAEHLLTIPPIRFISRRARVSPATAVVIADLCGIKLGNNP